jgi:hypothetical protein
MDTPRKASLSLFARALGADLNNFHLLHYRRVDGFLITAKNSGTHWLRFMLSHALAHEFGLPPPLHASGPESDAFIGHPRRRPAYPGVPWIGSSHNIPSRVLGARVVRRTLDLPQTVVLVRDIRQAMLSHHLKWRETFGLSLSEYLRIPPPGRKRMADIWWYIDFFNRWGRMAFSFPHEVLIVRYEDLLREPAYWLRRIIDHYGLSVSPAAIQAALAVADKDSIRRRLDPEYGEAIVPDAAERRSMRFDAGDEAYFSACMDAHLRFAFGYGYGRAGRPSVIQPEAAPLQAFHAQVRRERGVGAQPRLAASDDG